MATGFKYHAITHDKLHDKWIYDPETARGKAGLHASHFRQSMARQVESLAQSLDRPPLVVSPYDAELFGHWWFEGPIFLDDLFRQLHFDQEAIETVTPGDYLERHPRNQLLMPNASSWGAGGFNRQWLNESNAWVWRHLHHAAERMTELARSFGASEDALVRRALDQAARELMLAQSSDWTFIMSTGTTVDYAIRRFGQHIDRFLSLDRQLTEGRVDEGALAELEGLDAIFPALDARVYSGGCVDDPALIGR